MLTAVMQWRSHFWRPQEPLVKTPLLNSRVDWSYFSVSYRIRHCLDTTKPLLCDLVSQGIITILLNSKLSAFSLNQHDTARAWFFKGSEHPKFLLAWGCNCGFYNTSESQALVVSSRALKISGRSKLVLCLGAGVITCVSENYPAEVWIRKLSIFKLMNQKEQTFTQANRRCANLFSSGSQPLKAQFSALPQVTYVTVGV